MKNIFLKGELEKLLESNMIGSLEMTTFPLPLFYEFNKKVRVIASLPNKGSVYWNPVANTNIVAWPKRIMIDSYWRLWSFIPYLTLCLYLYLFKLLPQVKSATLGSYTLLRVEKLRGILQGGDFNRIDIEMRVFVLVLLCQIWPFSSTSTCTRTRDLILRLPFKYTLTDLRKYCLNYTCKPRQYQVSTAPYWPGDGSNRQPDFPDLPSYVILFWKVHKLILFGSRVLGVQSKHCSN